MNQPELLVEAEINKLNDTIKSCRVVEETVSTEGWKTVIEPLIDKMIMDITGSKVAGKWYGGLLDRAKKDERREFYIGYKQALIDLHRRVGAYVDSVAIYEGKKKELIRSKNVKYTQPMLDDTRYGRDFKDA